MEAAAGVPALPDLLDELERDVDVESLERLTQTLLQDIARDLEEAARKSSAEVSVCVFAGLRAHGVCVRQ